MRLIDADAISYTMLYKENRIKGTGVEAQGVFKSDIDNMPTIEERKIGHWDYNMSFCGSIKFIHRKCSECGYESMGMGTKYCPDCGAKMEEAEA